MFEFILFALAFSQSSLVATTVIEALCLKPSPYCEFFNSFCSTTSSTICPPSLLLPLASQMCLTDFANNTACSAITASSSALLSAIPNLNTTSTIITSICKEMPFMDACGSCGLGDHPFASANLQNCASLASYSNLCLLMPNMTQCYPSYPSFCTAIQGSSPFCLPIKVVAGSVAPKSDAASISMMPLSLLIVALASLLN